MIAMAIFGLPNIIRVFTLLASWLIGLRIAFMGNSFPSPFQKKRWLDMTKTFKLFNTRTTYVNSAGYTVVSLLSMYASDFATLEDLIRQVYDELPNDTLIDVMVDEDKNTLKIA
jgi:hypothetical protein